MISKSEFIHEKDAELTQKIFADTPFKTWIDKVHAENLDSICEYVYSASLPEISNTKLLKMRDNACEKFGVDTFTLYSIRNYDYEISCVGYNSPSVLISHSIIECGDEDILQARFYEAAAAISAGHHKLKFFIWLVENMSGIANTPLIGQAIISILYEWNRVRQFTLDRAVFLATENYALTLQNILYGVVPQNILQNFQFGTDNDDFEIQTKRYFKIDDPMQLIGKIFSYFSDYSWLPRRWAELEKFYHKH